LHFLRRVLGQGRVKTGKRKKRKANSTKKRRIHKGKLRKNGRNWLLYHGGGVYIVGGV